MRQLPPGRPPVGEKHEVRLDGIAADAVAACAGERWTHNKHRGAYARRWLLEQGIYAYERAESLMNDVVIAVLDQPCPIAGLEYPLATTAAPDLDTEEVHHWLEVHGAWDNADTDTYALVVPAEQWDPFALTGPVPERTVSIPRTQHARIAAEPLGPHALSSASGTQRPRRNQLEAKPLAAPVCDPERHEEIEQ